MEIHETWRLGLDLGIGSCGWAIVEESGPASGRIVALGVRTFDVPETDKERTPTNQLRRQHRGLRKVLRRRRQRMNQIRRLFRTHLLIADERKQALKISGLDPWVLRAEALERRLSGPELAVALGHIAKHRGFKSNSKRERGANAPKDSSAMLKAIQATRDRLAGFRTVGEMFARDPEYASRKRNRDGDYTRSILRNDQEREVCLLFDRQRGMGNGLASEELERQFIDAAFSQRPLADSKDKVGDCPFEPGEKRAARRSYSFELFRFLSRLAALRVKSGRIERPLTAEEIATASTDFGGQKGMTFKRLRKLLGLAEDDRFDGVPAEEEGKRDIFGRSSGNGCMQGTAALRDVLYDVLGDLGWSSMLATPEKLDRIAFVLSFREDIDSTRKGLDEIGLAQSVLDALMNSIEKGALPQFAGAGGLSAKACRNIIPHLKRGLNYFDACEKAGYDPTKSHVDRLLDTKGHYGTEALRKILRDNAPKKLIGSPVARKAVTEALKQVVAVVETHGLPGRIHVELARDVGKSKEERDQIKAGLDDRGKQKNKNREEFASVVGSPLATDEDLLRYELWKEQKGFCLYTDQAIDPRWIVSSDRTLEVDHILPRSKSGDDSFRNKTLCFASANQEKRGRTPYLWFGRDDARWSRFTACVDRCVGLHKQKRRNLLTTKSLSEIEEKFKPRNLNDTQFATRVLLNLLARMYPKGEQGFEVPRPDRTEREIRRMFARPGRLTDSLRRAWGMHDLKKGADGNRVDDDRHHALDALIVAATSEGALNRLTREIQAREDAGFRRDLVEFDPPWPGFVAETRQKLAEVFVSRAERRRARGEAHEATVRQIAEHDGRIVVYERKAVDKLTEKDLDFIPIPEPHGKVVDPRKLRDQMVESLRAWIAAGKPKGHRPLSPKGDPIVKVRLRTDIKPGVLVRGGAADRSKIVRVDIFENGASKSRSRYLLVPVYAHQISDREPPNRVFTLRMEYESWPPIPNDAAFLFSLNPMCFVSVLCKERGAAVATELQGYYRQFDANDGRITISDHRTKSSKAKEFQTRLSPTTIRELKKFHVDRLGRRSEIPKETRTWRGAVCT